MSDVSGHLLVADVPADVAVHRVSRALTHGRFHHVTDRIGPLVRLWVYCPGGRGGVRSTVRHIIETALAEARTPMPVVFADEQMTEPLTPYSLPAVHPSSVPSTQPTIMPHIEPAHAEQDHRVHVGRSLTRAG